MSRTRLSDIEIKITGLRPGEKLFEELLIGNTPIPTAHPDIFMGLESFLPKESLMILLDDLFAFCKKNDSEKAFQLAYQITQSTKEALNNPRKSES
jgi:FlaA1/EpsC-like NDP-sugar epimerase